MILRVSRQLISFLKLLYPVLHADMRRRCLCMIMVLYVTAQCSTLISVPNWHKKNSPVLYSGTRCDVSLLIENDSGKSDPVYAFDLPFSFVLDTVLLPVSIPLAYGFARVHKEIGFSEHCSEG